MFLSTNSFGDHRETLVIPFDQTLLSEATTGLRVLHVHGPDLGGVSDSTYPCEIINVDHRIAHSDTAQAFPRAVRLFGVNEYDSLYPSSEQVREGLAEAYRVADGRLIFGPGCTLHSDTPSRVLDVIARRTTF